MIPCSEDIRTRMFNARQNVRTPLDYDQQFEGQLPPEIRRELETSPYPINRWPARIPETEEEIEQALAWLKAQGFLQEPTPPAPPPQVLIRPAPVSPPAKPAENASRRGAGIWLLLAMLIGLPLLLTRLADNTPPQSRPVEVRRALPAVEVRRALPLVPHASPVTSPVVSNAGWQLIRMPDGSIVQASYQGELPNSAALPTRGRFIGEEYSTGNTSWVWMTPTGAAFPSWVDP